MAETKLVVSVAIGLFFSSEDEPIVLAAALISLDILDQITLFGEKERARKVIDALKEQIMKIRKRN